MADFGIFAGWLLASSAPVCYALDYLVRKLHNRRILFTESKVEAVEIPNLMVMPKIVLRKKSELPPSRIFLRYHKLAE